MEIPDFVYKFHKKGGLVITYVIIKQEVGAASYYQYQSVEGHWFMMKAARAAAITTYTFATPENNSEKTAAQGWTDRATLNYQGFYDEMGI